MAFAVGNPPEMTAELDGLFDSSQVAAPAAPQPHIATAPRASCTQHDDTSVATIHHDRPHVDDVDMTDVDDVDVNDADFDDFPGANSNDLLQQGWEAWRGTRTDSPIAYDQTAARSVIESESAQTCGESDFNPKRTLRPQHVTKQAYALPRFDNDSDDETYDPGGQPRRRRVKG